MLTFQYCIIIYSSKKGLLLVSQPASCPGLQTLSPSLILIHLFVRVSWFGNWRRNLGSSVCGACNERTVEHFTDGEHVIVIQLWMLFLLKYIGSNDWRKKTAHNTVLEVSKIFMFKIWTCHELFYDEEDMCNMQEVTFSVVFQLLKF